jgi:leucyl/phenylalanyl-tRNA--protein transferase
MLLPSVVLIGYENGYFPMAEPTTERIVWHRPDPRAIIPLDRVHIARSLRQVVQRRRFDITFDTSFHAVITHCADRPDTWITAEIIDTYADLHASGHAHSVEAWLNGTLVGGLYGVALGGAFFGESMFSHASNASKVAFVHLILALRQRGFTLLDTQYINEHTASLGAIEISDDHYQLLLADALRQDRTFGGILT